MVSAHPPQCTPAQMRLYPSVWILHHHAFSYFCWIFLWTLNSKGVWRKFVNHFFFIFIILLIYCLLDFSHFVTPNIEQVELYTIKKFPKLPGLEQFLSQSIVVSRALGWCLWVHLLLVYIPLSWRVKVILAVAESDLGCLADMWKPAMTKSMMTAAAIWDLHRESNIPPGTLLPW